MPIDCSKTFNFFNEFSRMCDSFDYCSKDCPLYNDKDNGGTRSTSCPEYVLNNPLLCVNLVQEWSDTHPGKTYADVFLEKFPNAQKTSEGRPAFCRDRIFKITGRCSSYATCDDCWFECYPNTEKENEK